MESNPALSPDFLAHIQNLPGIKPHQFVEALLAESPTSIRLNPTKPIAPIDGEEKIDWSQNGYYLKERPIFTLDPSYHGGAYYVQEAASMAVGTIVKHLLTNHRFHTALDLCAAPGGKTTDIASVLPKDTFILANELIKNRTGILYENIVKWGNDNVYISQNDPKYFGELKNFFDLMVCDVPCSGSGMFRKDPQTIAHWSLDSVGHCSMRQQRIIEDVWPALKPGGIMIYATCSYSMEEDEQVIEYICNTLGGEILDIPLPNNNIYRSENGYRFYPDQVKSEGFFVSVIQKAEALVGDMKPTKYGQKLELNTIYKKDKPILDHYITLPQEHLFDVKTDIYYIKHPHELQYISQYLNVYKRGVRLGKVMRKELIPDHELGMMNSHEIHYPAIHLDKETALNYLRKNSIQVEGNIGWNMVYYNNIPMGFLKHLGTRSNNYYPTEWRIRNL